MIRHLKCLILVVFTALMISGPLVSAYAQNNDIEYYRTEATNARAFADKQRAKAEEWHKKAENARKQARESTHKRDREGWADDAKTYEERAEAAAIEADKAEAKAVKAEAELMQAFKKLERGPQAQTAETTASESDNSKAPPLKLKDAIGFWEIGESGNFLVIAQENPGSKAYSYKLEAHTKDRVWKGIYTPFEEGDVQREQDAAVVFKYTPKAEEMNPDIPEWARRKIAGQLEWEIHLDRPQVCGGEPTLDGKFFPGKVKWSEESKIAELDGRGEPRPFLLNWRHFEPEKAVASTAIRLRPPGIGRLNKDGEHIAFFPLTDLLEGQVFYIDALLPYDLAKETGETLSIKISGTKDGGSETVTLKRGKFRKGAAVKYTHYEPLYFGDGKTFFSESWWANLKQNFGQHGKQLDLGLTDGEGARFTFDQTSMQVPVYKTVESYALARYMEAARHLKAFYAARVANPKTKPAFKENAQLWFGRLQNFEALMRHPEHPTWLKVILAKTYIGSQAYLPQIMSFPDRHERLATEWWVSTGTDVNSPDNLNRVQLTDAERIGDNDPEGRFDGVVWVNNHEKTKISNLLDVKWREKAKTAFLNFSKNLTVGLYEFLLSEISFGFQGFSIGIADIHALVTGTDHYGHKVSTEQKLDIVLGVMMSRLESQYQPDVVSELQQGLENQMGYGDTRTGQQFATASENMYRPEPRRRNVQRQKVKLHHPGKHKNPDLPNTLSTKQKEHVAPALAADNHTHKSSDAEAVSCAPPRTHTPNADADGDEAHLARAMNVGARYGVNADIVKIDSPNTRQPEFGFCQMEAILHAAGADMSEMQALKLMVENSEEFAAKLRTVSREKHPLLYGLNESEAELLANLIGRETVVIPKDHTMSMQALKNWQDNGWSIKASIHANDYDGPGDNKHSVDIVKIEQNTTGCGYAVTVYDKDMQATVKMPAEDFEAIQAKWDIMFHRQQEGVPVPKRFARKDDGTPPPRVKKNNQHEQSEPANVEPHSFNPRAHDPDNPIGPDVFDPDEPENIPAFDNLDDAWTYMHPDINRAPKANAISGDVLEALVNGRTHWQPAIPKFGEAGASFSYDGRVLAKTDGKEGVISIKPGHEKYIDFYNTGYGYTITYWPSGEVGVGQSNTYIPRKHLRYMTPETPYWQDLPE